LSAAAAPGFDITTKSQAGSSLFLKDSRAKRLSVLLSIALFAERREIVKPKRAAALDPAHASTVKKRSEERIPFTSTRPNSVELRSRCSRVKPCATDFRARRVDATSGRETGSTFRAPAFDDFLSTARRHAGSETVRAFAAQVARLIRSFHEQKQIDGARSERGTLRADARPVNTASVCACLRALPSAPDACLWITGRRSY
jgi:hypothetical protein